MWCRDNESPIASPTPQAHNTLPGVSEDPGETSAKAHAAPIRRATQAKSFAGSDSSDWDLSDDDDADKGNGGTAGGRGSGQLKLGLQSQNQTRAVQQKQQQQQPSQPQLGTNQPTLGLVLLHTQRHRFESGTRQTPLMLKTLAALFLFKPVPGGCPCLTNNHTTKPSSHSSSSSSSNNNNNYNNNKKRVRALLLPLPPSLPQPLLGQTLQNMCYQHLFRSRHHHSHHHHHQQQQQRSILPTRPLTATTTALPPWEQMVQLQMLAAMGQRPSDHGQRQRQRQRRR